MDDLKSTPRALSGLVDHQDEAVVSRTLMKSAGATVTLFAFAAGQELSEHTVPHDALVHVLEGEAEIRIDGEPRSVKAGEALIMPGGHPHAVKAPKPFKMLLTLLRSS